MVKRIQFSIDISAPPATVFRTMLDPEAYKDWTSAFAEGSYYEGSWQQGGKIKFLSPSGDGIVSEIAEAWPKALQRLKRLCEGGEAAASA